MQTEEKNTQQNKIQPQEPAAGAAPTAKRLPWWLKAAAGIALALAVLACLAAAYLNGKLDLIRYHDGSVDSVGSINADEDQDLDGTGLALAEGEMEMPEGSPFRDSNVLNILLIGTDERTDAVNDWDAFTHLNELDGTAGTTEFSEDARADTLILVSLNIQKDTIKLVSIERGTGVPILLDGYEGQYDWITHTFRYGGAKLAKDTVEDCFNVQVDHYVRVNFNSFVQIVDAVGGVDIRLTELEAKALNWEVPSNSMLIVNKVHQGWNHFDGYTALQYARLRKIDDDWKRIERQRTVIQAVLDAVKTAGVTELDSLLTTVLPLVQTDFTKSEIAALLVQLPGFLGAQTEQISLPVEGSYGVRYGMDNRLMYDPDWTQNIRALHDFLYEDASDSDAYPMGALTPETAAPADAEPEADAKPLAVEEYLAQNSGTVDLAYPFGPRTLGSAGDSTLFVTAEQPQWVENYQLRRALTQYLHENEEVRCLLVDAGMGAGLLLDDYINGGEEEHLERYLAQMAAETGWAEEVQQAEREFWQWLRAYNARQADGSGLHVFGLGADTDGLVALDAMALLADSEKTPDPAIAPAVRTITGKGNIRHSDGYFAMAAAQMKAAMEENAAALEKYFGVTWPLAEQLYANWQHTLQYEAGGRPAPTHAEVLMQNFRFAYDWYAEQRFFAPLGEGQAFPDGTLAEAAGAPTLGDLLAGEDSPVQGAVCGILSLYYAAGEAETEGARPQLIALSPWERLDAAVLEGALAGGLAQDAAASLDEAGSPFLRQALLIQNAPEGTADCDYLKKLLVVIDPQPLARAE